jgi:hypothetical protein
VGWFGFNVMSAQELGKISGLVAVNSLMAMVGGTLTATLAGRNDPGFVHNGALAGLVAVCAGSDVMHPIGALVTGGIAGVLFVTMFTLTQNRLKVDDVLGVWPLHGLCGAWGGIACGIFGAPGAGGLGGVSLTAQIAGTALGIVIALAGAAIVYLPLRGDRAAAPGRRSRIRRRRPQHPPHLRDAGTRIVDLARARGHRCTSTGTLQWVRTLCVSLPSSRPAQPATAVRRHEDQVAPGAACRPDDRLPDAGVLEIDGLDRDLGRRAELHGLGQDPSPGAFDGRVVFLGRIHQGHRHVGHRGRRVGRLHVEGHHRGAAFAGEGDGVLERGARQPRAVDGHENPLEHPGSPSSMRTVCAACRHGG